MNPSLYQPGLLSPLGPVAAAVREQLPFIPALVVAGVAVAAVVAVALSDRPGVRPAFLSLFFSGLLVVNLVGLPVLPFMHWHKFTDVQSPERTFYDYRLVTADGSEVRFEERSLTNVDGAYMILITDEMRVADDARRSELSAYMLERARIHRVKVEERSPLHYLRFPPHSLEEWTADELAGHAEFVGLRTYERTVVLTDEGTGVVSDTETLVFEYREPASAVRQPSLSESSAPTSLRVPITAGGVR
jgi:hypothetical protein